MKVVADGWGEESPSFPVQTATSCSGWWAANSWPKSCEAVSHTQQWGYRRWASIWAAGMKGKKKTCYKSVCVCRGDRCVFLTPDVTEGVVRPAELQQAAVFVQFTDERQDAEKQPVCSFFLLLLLDLEDDILDGGTCANPQVGGGGSLCPPPHLGIGTRSRKRRIGLRLRSCRGSSLAPAGAAGRPDGRRSSPPPPPQTSRKSERRVSGGWPGSRGFRF